MKKIKFGASLNNDFETVDLAKASDKALEKTRLVVGGHHALGDAGSSLIYEKIGSPSILGFTDLNNAYWNLKADEILPEMVDIMPGNGSLSTINKQNLAKVGQAGRTLVIPEKLYYIDKGAVLEGGGGLVGLSRYKSQILTDISAGGAFVTGYGNEGFLFRDIYFIATEMLATSGSALKLDSPSGANQGSIIQNCIFAQFSMCIETVKALAWEATGNTFSQYNIAVLVQNEDHPDGGDSCLDKNLFVTNRASPDKIGILQYNSGGLKVSNNKINGGKYAYLMKAKGSVAMPTQSTSILILTGNSFEHQSNGAISLSRKDDADSSIRFLHAIIKGNMLNGQPHSGETFTPDVVSIADNLNLRDLVFEGNTVQISSNGGTGLVIGVLDQGIISGNVFDTGGSNVGTGLSTGENVYATVGLNRFSNRLAAATSIMNTTNTQVLAGFA